MQTLTTERLLLRPAVADDADFLLELLNSPAFLANIGDRNVRTPEQATRYLETAPVFDYGPDGFGFNIVELRATGDRAGICGLVKRETLDDVDLGYAILERFGRRGLATEAARAALEHAQGVLGLVRVVAIVSPENAASRRVLEAIGMRLERQLRLPGHEHETCLYARPARPTRLQSPGAEQPEECVQFQFKR